MKAIRIIAIVLMLVAAACGSSPDDATNISSSDAELSTGYGDGAQDTAEAEQGDGAPVSDSASESPDGDAVDGLAGNTGSSTDGDDDSGDSADDDGTILDTDAVGTGFLARVSDATVQAATGRFEGRLEVAASPDTSEGGSFDLTLAGAYDLDADAFDLTLDLSGLASLAAADASATEADMVASMFAEPVQLRSIGSKVWLRWGLLAGMFGAMTPDGGTAWIEATADEAASMTGQFGVDSPESPTDILQALADLDATVTEVGRETVRGAEATHYRVVIDLEAAAEKLPPTERAELEAELPGGISGTVPIDVWLDDNEMLRRLVIEIDDIESMGLGADAEAISSLLIEFDIFDVGEPVAIAAPPADQVIATDELGFGLDGGF